MGLYLLFLYLLIGPYLLISGRAPFPIYYGRGGERAWPRDLSSFLVRAIGLCFTTAGLLPLLFHGVHSASWAISMWLSILGFVILAVGVLRAMNQPTLW